MFNFGNMVDRYGTECKRLGQKSGSWEDDGDWIEGDEETTSFFIGAVGPLSVDDLKYVEDGTYSERDRRLYTTEKFKLKQKFEHEGVPYTIQNEVPYGNLSDVYIYIARWAGNEP